MKLILIKTCGGIQRSALDYRFKKYRTGTMQKKPGKKTIKNQNVGFLKAEKPEKMIIKNPNVRFFSDITTNKNEKLLGF